MNTKNVLGISALIIAAVFATQMMQQDRVEAQQSSTRTRVAQAVEYAMLEIEDESNVTFRVGGVINVRTESLTATYRRLGGTDRGTFSDLLDQIGSAGWQLIQKEGNTWIFSRTAR